MLIPLIIAALSLQVNSILHFNMRVKYSQKEGSDVMDTHERLRQLLDERGWTEYRLAKKCGLSESTIANIFKRNTIPSIATLEAICEGFGITMSQFFAERDMVEITPELKELFDNWVNLTPEQKKAANLMLKVMSDGKKI